MALGDDVSPEDWATAELAGELRDTGNLHPLVAWLRDGEIGPERARDVLAVLADLDADLLVQITLDGLIEAYLKDPGLAFQPRRVVRGSQPTEAEDEALDED